jgi:hypothetical protein
MSPMGFIKPLSEAAIAADLLRCWRPPVLVGAIPKLLQNLDAC